MNTIAFSGTVRDGIGKKASKAVRNEGGIPCIMYGGDTNVSFSIKPKDIKGLIYTPDFKVAEITLDGTLHRCILKDAQFHPVNEAVLHADFLKLEEGRAVKVEVPVRFKGVSPGVKTGGKLQQTLRRIKIKTTPDKLVDTLFLDISTLELGSSARVKDVEVPEGVEVMNSLGIPVVSVVEPRALKGGDGEEGTEATAADAPAADAPAAE